MRILIKGAIFALVLPCLSATTLCVAQDEYARPPINYGSTEADDPVARLATRIERGEVELEYDAKFGYLKSVLDELDILVSSQTLVFSKTSLQLHRISPRRPRALYFNDDVYVGYCQKGDVLEIAATDSKLGAVFYTIDQNQNRQSNSETGNDVQPKLERDRGSCLTCHASTRTQKVPGYLVRSVFPDAAGRPELSNGTFVTDHTSEFRERWGGWYVSGEHGSMRHMGNVISRGDAEEFDREAGANDCDLSDNFGTGAYLTSHSDIVALMVLEHQTQMHNALAAANYETRRALYQSYEMNKLLDRPENYISDSARRRIDRSIDRILRYLLFADEFDLTDKVRGTSGFTEEFQSGGPRDSRGRSLRELDLATRLMKYPCSYLIYSDAFHGLPDEIRVPTLQRLREILLDQNAADLGGSESTSEAKRDYAHLDPECRRAIFEILSETHSEFASL
ncbi:MAG: hypothetical protein ACE361_00395 [Aureliella sp.]